MCCSSPPPPPDLGPMSEASEEVARIQQETAREQLDWARQQDARNQDVLQQVLDIQLPDMRAQSDQANADRERYNTQFKPMEDAFVEEAQNYDTDERREREMGGAIADVSSQFDAQRRNALSRLEGYGVDPSTTRNQALDVGVRTQEAMAKVGAATGAKNRVEETGRALRSDAINMGRGALSNAAGFYGQAMQGGNSGVGNANQTTGAGAGALQSSLGFSGQALQGYGQSADIQSQGFNNSMASWQAGADQTAGMLQGAGGIAGMFMADGGEVEGNSASSVTAQQGIPGMMQAGAPPPQQMAPDQGMINTGMGDGSGIDDSVPAQVSDGEYIIPADVVAKKGTDFFDKLVEQYHTPAAEQRAQ